MKTGGEFPLHRMPSMMNMIIIIQNSRKTKLIGNGITGSVMLVENIIG